MRATRPTHEVMSSVRLKILAPLSLVGTAIALGSTWWIGDHLSERLEGEARRRADALVHAVGHAAETAASDESLQRFVQKLGAEPEVDRILVVGGLPTRVLATTRADWLHVHLWDLREEHFVNQVLNVITTGHPSSRTPGRGGTLRAIKQAISSSTGSS